MGDIDVHGQQAPLPPDSPFFKGISGEEEDSLSKGGKPPKGPEGGVKQRSGFSAGNETVLAGAEDVSAESIIESLSLALQEDTLAAANQEEGTAPADSAHWESDTPQLAAAGSYDTSTVQGELKGNAWLSSSFMTTLTMNLMRIVKTQEQIKLTEAQFMIENMQATWDLAVELGDMILEKAEKEADMYRMMAIFSCVALGVAVVGFGIQVGGMGANYRKANIEDGTTPTETDTATKAMAGGSKGVTIGSQRQSTSSTPAPEGPETSTTASTENKGWTKTKPSQLKAEGTPTSQSAKPTTLEKLDADADVELPEATPTAITKPPAQPAPPAATKSTTPLDAAPESNPKDAVDTSKTGTTVQKKSGGVSSSSGVQANTGRSESGPRSAQEAETAVGSGSPSGKTKWYNNPKKLELFGGTSTSLGTLLAQQAHTIDQIGSNFIQSFFKPEIGKRERMIEIQRAAQNMAKQAMENANQSFNGASQAIDGALDFLRKIQDEVSRAHSLRG